MKIRTLDELLEKISADRVWRIREIAALRGQCSASGLAIDVQRAMRRSFVPIAYAHWEGFVKKTASYYLEFVAMQRLRLSELSPAFMSMYLAKEFSQSITQGNSYSLVDVFHAINEKREDRIRLPYKDVVQTKSNLNSAVLKDVCRSLGVDYRDFESKEIFIDFGLVGKRNHIAHGELQDIDKAELDRIKYEVVLLIDVFRNKIENAAIGSDFQA